jgi:hypothetical protein
LVALRAGQIIGARLRVLRHTAPAPARSLSEGRVVLACEHGLDGLVLPRGCITVGDQPGVRWWKALEALGV